MLKLIPTPIGNLEDITFRSLKGLEEAEIFLCEDTRITKKLLKLLEQKYQIKPKSHNFFSMHSHNEESFFDEEFLEMLKTKNVVYVSDAGMPCISDPGSKLVEFSIKNQIPYDVLPGANALLTAFAMSGFESKEFIFFGFLDHKGQNREYVLKKAMENEFVSILYEAPHRIEKLAQEIAFLDENRVIFAAKELTKLHQKIFKTEAKNFAEILKTANTNGEWVVIISPSSPREDFSLEDILDLNISLKEKARMVAKLQNISPKEAYNNLLKMDHK